MAAHEAMPVANLNATITDQAHGVVGANETARSSIGDDSHKAAVLLHAAAKRTVDLVLGAMIAVAIAPLMLVIAAILACTSRGPVLVRETRVGRGGIIFNWIGFRTCAGNGDKRTGFGALLYRARLDELPQIFNVLRGQMSIVGPRAESVDRVRSLSAILRDYPQRHRVKPGLTGWSQTMEQWSSGDEARRLAYDLYYVRRHSLALDLWILMKTFGLVVQGGAGR